MISTFGLFCVFELLPFCLCYKVIMLYLFKFQIVASSIELNKPMFRLFFKIFLFCIFKLTSDDVFQWSLKRLPFHIFLTTQAIFILEIMVQPQIRRAYAKKLRMIERSKNLFRIQISKFSNRMTNVSISFNFSKCSLHNLILVHRC